MADPVATQEAETDDEGDAVLDVFTELAELYQSKGYVFTAADIAGEMTLTGEKLRGALANAGCRDATNATRIGYWLRSNRDRVAGAWKLINRPEKHRKTAVWRLQSKFAGDSVV
jgi:hypothetical protein